MTLPDGLKREIEALRAQRATTRRATVPALEEVLYAPVPVLDRGFVRVVDYMGNDAAVVQAARVSYGRGTRKVNEDRGLLRYLMRHRHTTPFEMCEIKLHCKLPIFVARQWVRHRTASVNEYSARYSVLDKEFYLPAAEDLGLQAASNRQGRGAAVSAKRAAEVMRLLREDAERSYAHYLELLGTSGDATPEGPAPSEPRGAGRVEGIARELARMNLNLSFYTQWYWKVDLHNLLHFLSLRLDVHAQKEIRLYAEAIAGLVKRWVPATWEAFVDYRLGAATLSKGEVAALREMLAGKTPDLGAFGLGRREQEEFRGRFGLGET